MKVGSIVVLRSGGPDMTVVAVPVIGMAGVDCGWFCRTDNDDWEVYFTKSFPPEALKEKKVAGDDCWAISPGHPSWEALKVKEGRDA